MADGTLLLSIGLCAIMLIASYLVYRLRKSRPPVEKEESYGVVLAAVLALLGLLLGFTMQTAMNGLVLEWQLTLRELNASGTAYLRIDLLPENDQPEIRYLFRNYLDERLHAADIVRSGASPEQAMRKALQAEQKIWNRAMKSEFAGPNAPARLFIVSLNEMIDATEAHAFAQDRRLPTLVLILLFASAVISTCFIGISQWDAAKWRNTPIGRICRGHFRDNVYDFGLGQSSRWFNSGAGGCRAPS